MKIFKQIHRIFFISKSLYAGYRLQFIVMSVLGFLNAFLEGVGVSILVPLFALVVGEKVAEKSVISEYADHIFSFLNFKPTIQSLLALIVIMFVLKAFSLWFSEYLNIKLVASYEKKERAGLYLTTLKAKWSYLSKQKLGELENVLMVDLSNSVEFMKQVISIVFDIITFIVYAFFSLAISKAIALSTLVAGIIIFFLFRPFVSRSKLYSRQFSTHRKEVAHRVNENIIGLKTIKSLHLENEFSKESADLFEKLRTIKIKQYLPRLFTKVALEPLGIFFIAGAFLISYNRPGFNLAVFTAVVYLTQRIFVYVEKMQASLHTVNSYLPYAENLLAFKKTVELHKEEAKGELPFSFKDKLDFKNVSFSYDKKEKILDGVNLSVKRGEFIAIMGMSGGGKSTLVDLLLRLYEPNLGEILIDGKNISEYHLSEWRRKIGYVSQEIFLKNDTVRNNVQFYERGISNERITSALIDANIYDFISALPEGLETKAGERGTRFSVGQRQRIGLARVLVREPEVLVLDEATSALDEESEKAICDTLEKLKRKITIIVIAHHSRITELADEILILEKGQIKNGSL
ncbi:hypothetical protein A3H65_04125 [Candidatus Giovannonibacteria bacterium RIFCSPLOWO2_02_FULL_45_14]|nr:MAG: hypothetical protein A3H65_04125 [Candidatus Giovannonibacteria bacterium RIFCSPLOWO2_02_FULL_45_14]